MVLVAAASDHRHRRAAKPSRQDTKPVAPSPSKVPAGKASAGEGLLGFSFSWEVIARDFAIALTREEIARDFAAIRHCCASGTRPVPAARRSSNSKKWPKPVQNAIDKMCPGLILMDVDLDNYKIEERDLKR